MSLHTATTSSGLQNRGAGASSLAGSIPVRLRYQGFWLRRARDPRILVRFTGLKNRCMSLFGRGERPRGTSSDLAAVLCSSGPTGSYAAPRLRVKGHERSDQIGRAHVLTPVTWPY